MSKEKQIEEKEMHHLAIEMSKAISDMHRVRYIDDVKKLEAVLKENGWCKQEWISVEDRLPENDYGKHWKDRQYYLVVLAPSGLMRVAHYGYKEYDWWIDSHDTVLEKKNFKEVTHWMPLPEAPKMKG